MPFLSDHVYAARRQAMSAFMDEEGLHALALLTPDFCFYATNLEPDVLTWERPVVVVVPKEGPAFALLHELSANHVRMAAARGTVWINDIEFYAEHPRVDRRLALLPQWPQRVAEMLREHGLTDATVGVDTTSRLMLEAADALPRLVMRVVDPSIRSLRLVKHEEELELARAAASLADWGQEHYRNEVREGRLLKELDWNVGARIFEEAARRHPGENVDVRIASLSGAGSAAPHGFGINTDSRIERGHGIVNIIILRLNGVTIENERTWFCGTPTVQQTAAHEVAVRAQEAAIAEVRTGNAVRAIDAAALRVFEDAGYGAYVCHRTGHGVGIGRGASLTAHDFPHDMAFSKRPLIAGEIYSVEPGVYLPGIGGFRFDDTVIVGDEPEVITHTAKDIGSLTIPVAEALVP